MNCKIETENKDSGELDLQKDASDSKFNLCVRNDITLASPAANVNCEDLQVGEFDKADLTKDSARERVQNDTSSSELSTQGETLAGINDDAPVTTDSDHPIGEEWKNTSRAKPRKRRANPLIKDWESNDSWTSEKTQEDRSVLAEENETKRRKIKRLQQKNRRLKVRHSRLKAAIKEMKASMADKA